MPPKKKSLLEQAKAESKKKAKEEIKKKAAELAAPTTVKDLKTLEMLKKSKKVSVAPKTKYAQNRKDIVMEQGSKIFTMIEETSSSRELLDLLKSLVAKKAFINLEDEEEEMFYENQVLSEDLLKLSPKIIRQFVTDYRAQDKLSPTEYLSKWITGPLGKEMMKGMFEKEIEISKKEMKESEKEAKAAYEKKKIMKDLFGSAEKEEKSPSPRPGPSRPSRAKLSPPKEQKKAKMIDFKTLEVISPGIKRVTTIAQETDCIKDMKNAPWIKALVKGTIVHPKDENARKYLNPKMPVKHNGLEWFRPTKEYYEILCRSKRNQDGTVMTVQPESKEPFSVEVAYQTNRGILIQGEEMFDDQKKFFENKNKTTKTKIAELLAENITPESVKLARNELSRILVKAAPEKEIYGKKQSFGENEMVIDPNTEFIITVVDEAVKSSTTNEQLFRKIADIVVYLDRWVQDISFGIFNARIKEEYFLPESLGDLSPAEKLPEIFDDPRIPESKQEEVLSRLMSRTNEIVQMMGEGLYYSKNPLERVRKTLATQTLTKITIPKRDWKTICENSEDVQKIPDAELVFVKTPEGKIYCLTIKSLLDNFGKEDYTNPYTGENLPKEFVERFQKIYNIPEPIEQDRLSATKSPEKSPAKSPELAPGFLDILFQDVAENEKDMKRKREDKDQDEKGEDENYELVSNFSDSSSAPSAEENLSNCKKCNRDLDDATKLKSIMFDGKKPVKVAYCSFDCFEESSSKEWPKREGTRSRRKTNGKKRSRK